MGDWLLWRLSRPDVLRIGDFTASHGKRVPQYVDMRTALLADSDVAALLGPRLVELLPRGIEVLAFPAGEASGILAAAARGAYEDLYGKRLPLLQVRKQPKEYGPDAGGWFSGGLPIAGERYALIDDVFTSGATLRHALEKLDGAGMRSTRALTVVEHAAAPFPISRRSLYTVSDLIRAVGQEEPK